VSELWRKVPAQRLLDSCGDLVLLGMQESFAESIEGGEPSAAPYAAIAPPVLRDVRLKDETWGHLSCRETQQRPKEKNDEEVND